MMNNLKTFLQTHKRLILLLFLAFFVRSIPACLFFGSFDSFITEKVYYCLKTGDLDTLYGPIEFDHSPGFLWLVWIIGFCAESTGIPYHILFKFPAIFADLAITILIYKVFLNLGSASKKSSNAAALYALNPVPILISSINGQADTLLIFFCLLSWYFWRFGKRLKVSSAVFLGIGAIIKEFPAILFPAFWGKLRQGKERRGYLGFFLLPILIGLVIAYFTTTLEFIPNVLKKRSSPGFWGISLISMYLSNNINHSFFTGLELFVEQYMRYVSLGIIAFVWALCFKRKDALASIILIFATFYFIAPGFAAQYLVWIIPFAVIAKDPILKPYTIFASVVLVLWYSPLLVMGNPFAIYHSIKWLNFTRNLFSVLGWTTSGIWMYRLLKVHFQATSS